MQILLSRSQAGPGRKGKQEQEEISPNHIQAFFPSSVFWSAGGFQVWLKSRYCLGQGWCDAVSALLASYEKMVTASVIICVCCPKLRCAVKGIDGINKKINKPNLLLKPKIPNHFKSTNYIAENVFCRGSWTGWWLDERMPAYWRNLQLATHSCHKIECEVAQDIKSWITCL